MPKLTPPLEDRAAARVPPGRGGRSVVPTTQRYSTVSLRASFTLNGSPASTSPRPVRLAERVAVPGQALQASWRGASISPPPRAFAGDPRSRDVLVEDRAALHAGVAGHAGQTSSGGTCREPLPPFFPSPPARGVGPGNQLLHVVEHPLRGERGAERWAGQARSHRPHSAQASPESSSRQVRSPGDPPLGAWRHRALRRDPKSTPNGEARRWRCFEYGRYAMNRAP